MIIILSNILLLFGIGFLALFLYSLTKNRNGLSVSFALLCLVISIYILGYGFELKAQSIEEIKYFLKMEHFGVTFMSGFWMILTYRYYFKTAMPIKMIIILMIIPFLTLFFASTNEYHHFMYTNITAMEYKGHLLAVLSKGPWNYVNIIYIYLIQVFSVFVFIKSWQKERFKIGTQSFWMLLAAICPWVFNIIFYLGYSPLNIDLTPFGLSFSGVFFYIAIFKHDFLDIKELVKDVTLLELNEGIIVIDDKKRLIDYNRAAKEVFNWLDKSHIGTDISRFKDGEYILEQIMNQFEIEVSKEGIEKHYEFNKTILNENNKVLGCVYIIQDITKQREMLRVLDDLANYDALTKIYNRRKLIEEAEKELLKAQRHTHYISFLMFDIDHFKFINDNYGHLAGDEVLRELARTCSKRIRRTDILGRYGGEEFLIVLPETTKENAFQFAENLRELISEMEIFYEGQVIQVKVSIGIESVLMDNEDYNIDKLIDNADKALYQAKKNGRNQTVIYET